MISAGGQGEVERGVAIVIWRRTHASRLSSAHRAACSNDGVAKCGVRFSYRLAKRDYNHPSKWQHGGRHARGLALERHTSGSLWPTS